MSSETAFPSPTPSPTPSPAAGEHAFGVTLILVSSAFFAMAGIFIKAISTDPWTIACWRGLIGGLIIAGYVLWRSGRSGARLSLGWRGWSMVAVGSLSSMALIASYKFTYVANVAIIYATVPLMAAALEWLMLGARPQTRTLAMALLCLAGVVIIVSGGLSGGHMMGDLFAVAMTAGSALYMVMIRAFRDTPVVWVAAISSCVLFCVGWLVADPLSVSAADAWRIAAFGTTFAGAVITWTEGTRRLPAAEAGVLGAAEVPLAILFAWTFLAELPPAASLAGGAVVMAAVLFHALRPRKAAPQPVG